MAGVLRKNIRSLSSACVVMVLLALGSARPAAGGTVVLRILATNPDAQKARMVAIKSNLPPRVREADVKEMSGLQLGYDYKNDIYYVHQELELGPKDSRVFDVVIDDIWVIPPDTIDALSRRALDLSAKLAETEYKDRGALYSQRVARDIEAIRRKQVAGAVGPGVKPIQHIGAFEENQETLKRVTQDIGRLENLVLGAGLDPGTLVGTTSAATRRRETKVPEGGYKTAILRISIHNSSPDRGRSDVTLKRNLPTEIRAQDVLDPGGLEIGIDPQTDVTYVYKRGLELEPQQTLTFEVRLHDKWNINEPRIEVLRTGISTLVERLVGIAKFKSLEDSLQDMLVELSRIEATQGPQALNAEYVAFYREQGIQLDLIEQKLNRIEAALRPMDISGKWGFPIKPPSAKTTWLLIYIILGFLAAVSLVFFFRWYGRGKAEKIDV